jgi:hypothetical protein
MSSELGECQLFVCDVSIMLSTLRCTELSQQTTYRLIHLKEFIIDSQLTSALGCSALSKKTTDNIIAAVVARSNTLSFGDAAAKTLLTLPDRTQSSNFYFDTTAAFDACTNNVITIQNDATTLVAHA